IAVWHRGVASRHRRRALVTARRPVRGPAAEGGIGMKRLVTLVLALAWSAGPVAAQPAGVGAGHGAPAHDMALVGVNDLQGRAAYQPVIHRHPDGRWIAYIRHHGRAQALPMP